MTSYNYRIRFTTPLFSKGSYDDRPEIRPPSIRGQLHWWFRALGYNYQDEKAIFGGVHGGAIASKVMVRVGGIKGETGEANTLPHKTGGQASPKWAYKPGTAFDLHISERLGGLSEKHRAAFQRALETWLLLGTLGLRATRGGGSFVWEAKVGTDISAPATFEDYANRIRELLEGAPLKAAILPESFTSAEAARGVVSDTLGGRQDHPGENDLARLNHPLGRVFGGRKTSPLRFRIVQIGSQFHIAAVWDARSEVTGNRPGDLQGIIDLLASRRKEIGRLMKGHLDR
jgi:hypothetical protein